MSTQQSMALSEEDIQFCQKAFSEYDKDGLGAIKVTDLKPTLESIGLSHTQRELLKLISEVDEKNTGLIKFSDLLSIYQKHKYADAANDDQDLIDAFVAMGGNEDTSGSVDANLLIKIIKEEFQVSLKSFMIIEVNKNEFLLVIHLTAQMTIDIVGLIREVDEDGSGEIEFEEFKTLLKAANHTQ